MTKISHCQFIVHVYKQSSNKYIKFRERIHGMLRVNATLGIHLPEGNSKWSAEKTLRQWKIAQSLSTNGRKVLLNAHEHGGEIMFQQPMEFPLDTKLMQNKGKKTQIWSNDQK